MCKVLILTCHDSRQREALISKAWAYFHRSGETDGFGAAWFTRSGDIQTCRSSHPTLGAIPPAFALGFASRDSLPSDGGFLLIHGRKATCGINLDNTHPFTSETAALIHNGIVQSETYKNETSTCDSELILRAFEDKAWAGLAEISGYFAIGVLQLIKGRKVLHVGKCDTARLRVASYRGGFAFGTTNEAIACAGEHGDVFDVAPFTGLTFRDAKNYTQTPFGKFTPPRPHITPYSVASKKDEFDNSLTESEYWRILRNRKAPKRYTSEQDLLRDIT